MSAESEQGDRHPCFEVRVGLNYPDAILNAHMPPTVRVDRLPASERRHWIVQRFRPEPHLEQLCIGCWDGFEVTPLGEVFVRGGLHLRVFLHAGRRV